MKNKYERVVIPETLKKVLNEINLPTGCYIAGGIIYNHFVNDNYTSPDIDVFGNGDSVEEFELINNNILLTKSHYGNYSALYKDTLLSFNCLRPVGTAESVLDDFDFSHCRMLYDGTDELLVEANQYDYFTDSIIKHGAIWHAENKVLGNINMLPCTAYNTLKRVFRFINRGFTLCKGGPDIIIDGLRSADGVEQMIMSFNSMR